MACDEGYAMPLATTLLSMVEANQSGQPIDVYILTAEFTSAARQRVVDSVPQGAAVIHWVPVELESFQKFTTRTYISKMTYARLLLPELIPSHLTRVLYLDADILVLGDLTPLSTMDLEGCAYAAVIDTDAIPHAERLGLYQPDGRTLCEYFNAGVMLVDLKRWREENISEKSIEFMIQNPETILADQDALNFACGGRWKRLHARWNFQEHDERGYANVAPAERPAIVHFAGKWKPWNPKSVSVDAVFYDGFRERTLFGRSSGQKTRDALEYGWSSFKCGLRQYKLGAWLHRQLGRSKSS
jgi:lipopolysaccharide biosynthesis glycosyltransferase